LFAPLRIGLGVQVLKSRPIPQQTRGGMTVKNQKPRRMLAVLCTLPAPSSAERRIGVIAAMLVLRPRPLITLIAAAQQITQNISVVFTEFCASLIACAPTTSAIVKKGIAIPMPIAETKIFVLITFIDSSLSAQSFLAMHFIANAYVYIKGCATRSKSRNAEASSDSTRLAWAVCSLWFTKCEAVDFGRYGSVKV
jgi:hypothetical protein